MIFDKITGSVNTKTLKVFVIFCFVLIAILGSYFIIKDANWIFGDDHEFLVSTAIGKIESINHHMGGGRFNPLQHYDYNILTLIPFGTTATAHYILVMLSFVLLTWLFTKNSYLISKKYSETPTKIWQTMLLSCLCFWAFLINPATVSVFLDIIFPERLLLILLAAFAYFYISALDKDEKWRYICALLCVVYASYMKEVVAGGFAVFSLTNLIFSYKNISKNKRLFYGGLIVNFFVYLVLYYILVFRTSSTFYNEGRGGLYYFDNMIAIFSTQKFLIPMFIFAIFRGMRILFYKDYKHLPFDSLLFMSVAYVIQYFILNLNASYYFEPAVFVGYIVMFYWFVCCFDRKSYRLIIPIICLLSIIVNYHGALRKCKDFYIGRNSFIPNVSRLITKYNPESLKMYTIKQGNFQDKKIYYPCWTLNTAINYLLKTYKIQWIAKASDIHELSKNDVILVSDLETPETKKQLNDWLITNDFSKDDMQWGLSIYSKKNLSGISYGTYAFKNNISDIMITGLSGIERFGQWSDSEKVVIKFMVPQRKNIKLTFDVFPFFAGKRSYQNVTVFVNDKKKAIWKFEKGKETPETTLNVFRNDIKRDNMVSVVFDIENPVSPKDLGVSMDARKLGIGFRTFAIQEQ